MNQLIASSNGFLCIKFGILIVRCYSGDTAYGDAIPWPMTEDRHKRNLSNALWDLRDNGVIDGDAVLLPDGTKFEIDEHLSEGQGCCREMGVSVQDLRIVAMLQQLYKEQCDGDQKSLNEEHAVTKKEVKSFFMRFESALKDVDA